MAHAVGGFLLTVARQWMTNIIIIIRIWMGAHQAGRATGVCTTRKLHSWHVQYKSDVHCLPLLQFSYFCMCSTGPQQHTLKNENTFYPE